MDEFEQVIGVIEQAQVVDLTTKETMSLFPAVVAHIIAESLGYATPGRAASILSDALAGRLNYCEWISACFSGDPRPAVLRAINDRDCHKGFMASYAQARLLVDQALETRKEPLLASWF